MADPIIQPFENVGIVDLPVQDDSRLGLDQFRSVMELQVGTANNESNPQVWRANRQGQWMGQKAFIVIPGEPINRKAIKFQVDMSGNITATSFKTAGSGQRVRIIDNEIQIYDNNGILRTELTNGFLIFYNPAGAVVGSVVGLDTPDRMLFSSPDDMFFISGDTLFFDPTNAYDFLVNGNIFLVMTQLLDAITCNRVLNLVALPADPLTGIDGAMFYADPTHPTDPDEFRVLKAGTWRNMITT